MTLDVNTASRESLIALKGIHVELADEIIKARPFDSIEELISIRGIGPKTLELLKEQGLVCQKVVRRGYSGYKAHELRKGVVHASDDELVVLLGDLVLTPGKKVKYTLEFPKIVRKEPRYDLRFVPKEMLDKFIEDCQDGELPVPSDFDSYPAPDMSITREEQKVQLTDDRPGRWRHRWEEVLGVETSKRKRTVEVEQIEIIFKSDPNEGAYIFVIETEPLVEGASDSFSVVVYNKAMTFFPESEDDDLAELLGHRVNLSDKDGLIWLVQPIYFVEQLLNVRLSGEVIEEMVTCEGLPEDLPANDDVLVKLQWGYGFQGVKKIRLDVDKDADECVQTDTVQVVKDEEKFQFSEFMKRLEIK